MREIKFRAWSKKDKCWCGAFSIHKSGLFTEIQGARMENGVCTAYADWIDLSKQDEIILMQYTGLKDKNGKEIYEGDVLKETIINQHGTFEKVFQFPQYESFSGGGMEYGIAGIGYSWDDVAPDPNECEVVGNIYEHPSLLQEEKGDE